MEQENVKENYSAFSTEDLIIQLQEAKQLEVSSKDFRNQIESTLIERFKSDLKDEGTVRCGPNGEIKIVTGLVRQWDDETILRLITQHPEQPWPFTKKVSESRTESRVIEKNNPDFWKWVEGEALTMKPKKASVSIERKETK